MNTFDKKLEDYLNEWSGAEQLDVPEMIKEIKSLIRESVPQKYRTRKDGVLVEIRAGEPMTVGKISDMAEENRKVGFNECREVLLEKLK